MGKPEIGHVVSALLAVLPLIDIKGRPCYLVCIGNLFALFGGDVDYLKDDLAVFKLLCKILLNDLFGQAFNGIAGNATLLAMKIEHFDRILLFDLGGSLSIGILVVATGGEGQYGQQKK